MAKQRTATQRKRMSEAQKESWQRRKAKKLGLSVPDYLIRMDLPYNTHFDKEDGAVAVDKSDGSTASYYELPKDARELQDLISFKNMNAQVGEAFRSLYRMGGASHSDRIRDCNKVIFYMEAEIARIKRYG